MKEQVKQFTKFISAVTEKPVYIDLSSVLAIDEWTRSTTISANLNGASYGSTILPTDYRGPNNPNCNYCTLIYTGHMVYHVMEHIAVVLALVEGRDPAPAKVIYGTKNNQV